MIARTTNKNEVPRVVRTLRKIWDLKPSIIQIWGLEDSIELKSRMCLETGLISNFGVARLTPLKSSIEGQRLGLFQSAPVAFLRTLRCYSMATIHRLLDVLCKTLTNYY
jgi:hypothetical protein